MFDTVVTVVGNVLTAPEWRRTTNTNALVANFKVASTARRYDREHDRWIDGNSLRVRVNCWRKLAEGVAASVTVGDPVVVMGRLYTRDWIDADGNARVMYELEAMSVGHDLGRGRSRFQRNRPSSTTSAVEGEDNNRVRGEATARLPLGDAPARPGELFDDPDLADTPVRLSTEYDPIAAVRGSGFDGDLDADLDADEPGTDSEVPVGDSDGGGGDGPPELPTSPPEAGVGGARSSRRARSRTPVSA